MTPSDRAAIPVHQSEHEPMTYHNPNMTAAASVFQAFADCAPDSPEFKRRAADVWHAITRAGIVNDSSRRTIRSRALRQKPCVYPFPMAQVEFADGMSFLFAFYSPAGKPLDWSHAERVAIGHWQARKLSAWRALGNGWGATLDDRRAAEAAFLRRNPPPAIVRMVEAHGTREQLAA
jgi:hypothetical protein